MATVIGHALAAMAAEGAVGGEARRPRALLAGAVLAMLPDLDVPAAIALKHFGLMLPHRGFTHSLLFGIFLALLLWLAFFRARSPRALAGLGLASLCHPLLDFLMACGPPVPLFRPFSSQGFLSPVQLIPTAYFARSIPGLLHVLALPETWKGIALETLIFLPLLLAGREQPTKAILFRISCAGLSLAGLFLTCLLYRHG